MKTDRRLPALWLFLFALALTALPFTAVTQQSLRLASGDAVSIPAKIVTAQNDALVPLALITTPLHKVSLSSLTGDNRFKPGDEAFIYISRSAGEVYPFAILRRAPQLGDRHSKRAENAAVMLRAMVLAVDGDIVTLSYSFDTISPPQAFISAASKAPSAPITLTLAVSPDGRSSVSGLSVGEQKFAQLITAKAKT